MAAGEAIGCFGLTEPDLGSDPGGMRTRARRDGGDWVLNGAQDVDHQRPRRRRRRGVGAGGPTSGGVRGFVVPTDTPGFSAPEIQHKLSLRASITAELVLDDVRLPADAVLPEVRGLKGPLSCLNEARFGIVWGALGAARRLLRGGRWTTPATGEQFGRPIAGVPADPGRSSPRWRSELHQGHAARAAPRPRARTPGRCAPSRSAWASSTTSRAAIDDRPQARTILGANGITLEYPVIRHANNLESVLTYEGTEEIHTLAHRPGPHRPGRLPLTHLRRSGPGRIVQKMGGPGADAVVGRYLRAQVEALVRLGPAVRSTPRTPCTGCGSPPGGCAARSAPSSRCWSAGAPRPWRVGLRVLGEALAPVRDSEVLLASFAGVDPEPAVLLVRQSLRESHALGRVRLLAAFDDGRHEALVRSLTGLLDPSPFRPRAAAAAGPTLLPLLQEADARVELAATLALAADGASRDDAPARGAQAQQTGPVRRRSRRSRRR